jgi:ATP-binding cassette subfamily F protein 3
VTLADIDLSFGGQSVLRGVSLQIGESDRIALAGANGSGKTTLMKVITGEIEPDGGVRSIAGNATVSYLPQIGLVHAGRTLYEEVEDAFSGAEEILREREEIGEILKEPERLSEGKRNQLLHRHQELYEELENRRYYSREQEIGRVLRGLGFYESDFRRDCEEFSGGWQMRIALAKRLLSRADVLLLDEPTNYLDLPAREWLQDFISAYPGTICLVSHDRAFLDETTDQVAELFQGRLKRYSMIYSRYERVRQEEVEEQIKAYQEQQAYIEKTEEFIRRFRYNAAKAKQVQSRVKELEKLERLELPEHLKRVAVRIPEPPHSGKEVLRLREVSRSYGEHQVLQGIDLDVERGTKLALIGRNGAGKSTLMRIIAGVDHAFGGERRLGSGVIPAWFSQNAGEELHSERTILEEVTETVPMEAVPKVRDTLGAFLFRGDDVHKPLGVLSGGEKSRVALVKLLMRPANLLLLDEPTNHLDMGSKDILCEALESYPGTLILVSHDRDFLRRLATHVLELTPPEATVGRRPAHWFVPGGYDYYLEQRRKAEAARFEAGEPSTSSDGSRRSATPGSPESSGAELSREEQKRIKNELRRLERREEELLLAIEEIEEEEEQLKGRLSRPENYTDHTKAQELSEGLEHLQRRHRSLMGEWEELVDRRERVRGDLARA